MRTSLKMLRKCALLLCLAATALAEDLPEELPNPGSRQARTQWTYHAADDSYRQASEGVSHGHAAPQQGLTLRATEPHTDYPAYSPSEYWRPNLTATSAYTHPRPYPLRATPPMLLYHTRPAQPLNKIHPNYLLPKPHTPDTKPKYKKTVLYQPHSIPTTLKKPLHPRVHKPYAKHKYPTHKTIHPPYRRYYQSPYQKYAIPLTDILRPQPAPDAHHTTERMDDAYPDDHAPHNDTHRSPTAYYDAYDDPDTTPDPDPAYDDTTPRNYYGDRIYMSTHLPLTAPDEPPATYLLLRRTSDDDDIETIFE